jgi:hypothetical protein
MKTFVERHAAKIRGTQSCFHRVVITGTLPDIAHAGAMAAYLTARHVRLFDYPQWAAPLRAEIRARAEQVACEAGLTIKFIQRKDFCKEARIKALLAERGDHPGLVHIFSAREPCPSFRRANVPYTLKENAFVEIDDWARAQTLADDFEVWRLHTALDGLARRCCPLLAHFRASYHWSVLQIE